MRALKNILFFVASFGAVHAASTTDTISGMQFGKTVFAPGDQNNEPALFAGAADVTTETTVVPYALSRIGLAGDAATLTAMAPTNDNGISISGKQVTNLDLLNKKYPVLTVGDEADYGKVFLIADQYAGTVVQPITVKDSADPAVDVAKPIAGLAASDKYIFVAVPKADAAFEAGTANGIAVIKCDDSSGTLTPVLYDAHDLQSTAGRAALLDVSPNGGYVSFVDDSELKQIEKAIVGKATAMCWDDVLQRLYIGFSSVTRDTVKNSGGVLGVAMGLITKDLTTGLDKTLTLYPVVYTPTKSLFYKTTDNNPAGKNVLDRMIGFYFDATKLKQSEAENPGTAEVSIQIPFVKTMHTSTGKHYLIVASKISYAPISLFPIVSSGGTMALSIQDGIYALPLIPSDKTATTNVNPDAHGVVAKVDESGVAWLGNSGVNNGKYDYPITFDDMPTKDQIPAQVSGDGWITDLGHVYDLAVVGDTVYISFGGGLEPWNKGVYATTAFFDKNGFICGWTPVKRVMGSVTHAYGLGLDANRGNFYFIGPKSGSTETAANTGYITQWGRAVTGVSTNMTATGDLAVARDKYSLSTVLETMFPQDQGGVYYTGTFDEYTPGFDQNGVCSLMVAVGYDKIALIQTGGIANGFFMPMERFVAGVDPLVAQNVFEKTDKILKDIAPLTCATVATDGTSVYVFVGGYKGVAKIKIGDYGLSSLNSVNFGDVQALTGITEPVISLLPGRAGVSAVDTDAQASVVCALTNKKIYVRKVSDWTTVADIALTVGALDFVVARNADNKSSTIVVGTKSGLKAFDAKTGNALDITNNITDSVVQLQYLSRDQVDYKDSGNVSKTVWSVPSTPGMVYAWVLGKKIDQEAVVPDGQTYDPSTSYPMKKVLKDTIVPQLYRFAVGEDNKLYAIDLFIDVDVLTGARPVLQLDTFRSGFFTDGSSVFYTAPKSVDNMDFLRVFPLSYTKSFTTQPTVTDDQSLMFKLGLDDSNFYIGRGGVEPASGKKYFCGDFGIRVNE